MRMIIVLSFSTQLSVHAFICSRVTQSDIDDLGDGPSLIWNTRTIPYTMYAAGTSAIANTDEQSIIHDSFSKWGATQSLTSGSSAAPTIGSCTYAEDDTVRAASTDLFFTEIPTTTNQIIGYDYLNPSANENMIIFYDGGSGNAWPYSSSTGIIALTTTTFNARTGEILDADIELNNDNLSLSDGSISGSFDLENTLVHEIGHFLGLGHSDINTPALCSNSTAMANRPSMCSTAQDGDIDKRDLACDDLQALMFRYPFDNDTGYCLSEPLNSDCGYCALPDPETNSINVRSISKNNGLGTYGCTNIFTSNYSLFTLIILILFFTTLRKTRNT